MAEANDRIGVLCQNLSDAGCDDKTIDQCLSIARIDGYMEILPILSQHKADLLLAVRSRQKQIDCLDYLIYKIQNKLI